MSLWNIFLRQTENERTNLTVNSSRHLGAVSLHLPQCNGSTSRSRRGRLDWRYAKGGWLDRSRITMISAWFQDLWFHLVQRLEKSVAAAGVNVALFPGGRSAREDDAVCLRSTAEVTYTREGHNGAVRALVYLARWGFSFSAGPFTGGHSNSWIKERSQTFKHR